MLNPPITGIEDLDAWLYNLNIEAADGFGASTAVVVSPISGEPVGYPSQFIHIKYADNNVGGGFINVPTGKMYWGVFNSASSTESTNPADYTWYKSPVGFGTLTFLYYQVIGGRQIKFALDTTQPSYKWLVDSGLALDLDSIVPASTITSNELLNAAVTELKIAASAVTATKINVAALDQVTGGLKVNTVSADQIMTNAVTELKILDGAVSNGKLPTGAITGDKIYANTITGNKIAALTIGAGAIAAGAITTTKLDAGAVTAAKIAAGTITADKMTAGTITASSGIIGEAAIVTANIALAAVDTLRIKDQAVTIPVFTESSSVQIWSSPERRYHGAIATRNTVVSGFSQPQLIYTESHSMVISFGATSPQYQHDIWRCTRSQWDAWIAAGASMVSPPGTNIMNKVALYCNTDNSTPVCGVASYKDTPDPIAFPDNNEVLYVFFVKLLDGNNPSNTTVTAISYNSSMLILGVKR